MEKTKRSSSRFSDNDFEKTKMSIVYANVNGFSLKKNGRKWSSRCGAVLNESD